MLRKHKYSDIRAELKDGNILQIIENSFDY